MNRFYVLVAHGTISDLQELPAFLQEIRRGRPASPELLAEMRHRYEAIGGSPLLEHTHAQAQALQQLTGVPTRVAMRLWSPRITEVVNDLSPEDEVVLIPLAPFSMEVYGAAAAAELQKQQQAPRLVHAVAWGTHPQLISAYQAGILRALQGLSPASTAVVITAHSLPTRVIQAGDKYQEGFERTAALVAKDLPAEVRCCYQSQGADGGQWLGPTLLETLEALKAAGKTDVVVSPIGFFAEHVETLYDLDIEAKAQAQELGLGFYRVPTLGTDPGLIAALAWSAEQASGI